MGDLQVLQTSSDGLSSGTGSHVFIEAIFGFALGIADAAKELTETR